MNDTFPGQECVLNHKILLIDAHDSDCVVESVNSQTRVVREKDCIPLLVFPVKPSFECKYEQNEFSAPKYGMYVQANLETNSEVLELKELIDTGATMSLMDMSVLEHLPEPYKAQIKENGKAVKFADGRVQKSYGTLSLVLKLGNEMKELDFLLGNFSDPAIFGMPDLQNLGLSIDFENVVVTKVIYGCLYVMFRIRC